MAHYEGKVKLDLNKQGLPTIMRDKYGDYDASNAGEFLTKIIEVGKGLSTWSLWVEKTPAPKFPANSVWTSKQLSGFLKDAKSVELVAVRRRGQNGTFFAPVIKIGYGETNRPTFKASSTKLC